MENSVNNINFFFFKDQDKVQECVMHSKSDNIEINYK